MTTTGAYTFQCNTALDMKAVRKGTYFLGVTNTKNLYLVYTKRKCAMEEIGFVFVLAIVYILEILDIKGKMPWLEKYLNQIIEKDEKLDD